MPPRDWNPEAYQAGHSFVWQYGRDVVGLLAPRPGERILDIGCGTGQLTAEIARAGAQTVGVDSSPAMIAEARRNFPELKFEVGDAARLPYEAEFDAVFSNAALHWVRDAAGAASSIAQALKPAGRFAAEFGGRGNVASVMEAAFAALESLGFAQPERLNPWYYPGIAEYASLLEEHGLEVTYAALFHRPTPLEGGAEGLDAWLDTFGGAFRDALGPARWPDFVQLTKERAAPRLFRNGAWMVDYRRLRVAAQKHT